MEEKTSKYSSNNKQSSKMEEKTSQYSSNNKHPYLILVPCHLQGHITPMLQLATILQLRGFSIIIAHTKLINPPSDFSSINDDKRFIFLPIGEENLADSESDQVTSMTDPISALSIINRNIATPFRKSLVNFMEENPSYHVSCVIHDILMYSTVDVASHLNLPSFILRTSSISSILLYSAILRLPFDDGCFHFPLKDSSMLEPIPEVYAMRYTELVSFINSFGGDNEGMINFSQIMCSKLRKSSAVIMNCLEHMEKEAITQFHNEYNVPTFAIGALHKFAPAISTSLISEDLDCLNWLNRQMKNSVLYVSIGSLVTMESKEITEMAKGLANSDQPFLWVIRPGSITGSRELLELYREMVGERGCIVKWAPQKEVLAHDSVGGFLSHCGWNSTLESICEGIPMICRPKFGDQWVNSRYVSHVWKVGFELEDVLNRENVEKTVRKLMQEVEGEEMRQRAGDLKEMAELAMGKDRTSYNSLNSLVEFILSF